MQNTSTDARINTIDSTVHATSTPDVPHGYSVCDMPDGYRYVVPDFMIRATDLAIEMQSQMRSINVEKAPGGVRGLFHSPFQILVPIVFFSCLVS